MLNLKNTVLFTLFAVNLIDQPAPEVRIEQGVVSGKISSDGKIHEYMGIPYATTNGRFQAPLPAPSWNGVYKAVEEHYQCPQAFGVVVIGTEDCLKINVYVPAEAGSKPLPVMFQIHGGAFVVGSGGKILHGPDFLVKHDVILVTINYRLGVLGFLCLGIEEAPGNAGLKDQIAALRWVKKNIAAFGGDPDNVTIFGHSAGGASVSLLVLSNAANGLFNRAIIQSGSALMHWASAGGVKYASSIAKLLNYDTNDPHELYKFFLNSSAKDLVMAIQGLSLLHMARNNLITAPCIEKEFPGIEPVFTELPYNVMKGNRKNISIIYGTTDREGIFLLGDEKDEHLTKFNEELYDFLDFEFPSGDIAQTVAKEVRQFYMGGKDAGIDTRDNLIELYGDTYFSIPLILESELMSNNNKNASIYNYYFKYAGGRNLVKETFSKNKKEYGASHGDDILYIFNGIVWPYRINKRDQKVIDWMTQMLTNFAKYGDPTPPSDKDLPIQWIPSKKGNMNFLTIDDKLEMGPIPTPERFKLWKDLYQKYRKIK